MVGIIQNNSININAKYQNGYKDSTIINTVKAYHKQAYIGSLGEWILIRKNIL